MQENPTLTLQPQRIRIAGLLMGCFLVLGVAAWALARRTTAPNFYEEGVDIWALSLVVLVFLMLPWAFFFARRLYSSTPAVSADTFGIFFDCTLLGQTLIPWFFVDTMKPGRHWHSHYLAIRLNETGVVRLTFRQRLLLSLGFGGHGHELHLPDIMHPGTSSDLYRQLEPFLSKRRTYASPSPARS